jgi:hypothetical protein
LEGGSDLVASWETTDGSQYALYHDSTGSASLSFSEGLATIEQPEEDGYLYRTIQITERWQHLAKEHFGIAGHGTLWGGRPDILIERYPPATEQPMEVFVGEVKYTTDRSYSAQGLRELLEYMAFVRSNADYLEDADDVLTSNRVKGALFVDRVEESVPIWERRYRSWISVNQSLNRCNSIEPAAMDDSKGWTTEVGSTAILDSN